MLPTNLSRFLFMYVITVEFLVKQAFLQQFLSAMHEQANNSLKLENQCHHFDVVVSTDNPCRIFLYEIYADKVAFDQHLASDHFIEFNASVSGWVANKTVNSWTFVD